MALCLIFFVSLLNCRNGAGPRTSQRIDDNFPRFAPKALVADTLQGHLEKNGNCMPRDVWSFDPNMVPTSQSFWWLTVLPL